MKTKLFLITVLMFFGQIYAQEKDNNLEKFIEVTGSADLEISPDEIILVIGIGEYWKEEFEGKNSVKKYKNKVSISEIENNLLSALKKAGIHKEQIAITGVGSYWKYYGKESLFEKQFEISLKDFNVIDSIVQNIDIKGIKYMRLGELKNQKITEYRKQVKIEALKAAKMKASYLLESMDKKLVDIISITEKDEENAHLWGYQNLLSNSSIIDTDNSGMTNTRKIKLRYEIKARFRIE